MFFAYVLFMYVKEDLTNGCFDWYTIFSDAKYWFRAVLQGGMFILMATGVKLHKLKKNNLNTILILILGQV